MSQNPYQTPIVAEEAAVRPITPRFRPPAAIMAALAAGALGFSSILPVEGSWRPFDSIFGYALRGETIRGLDVVIAELAPSCVGFLLLIGVAAHRRWRLVNLFATVYLAAWVSGVVVYLIRLSGVFGFDTPNLGASLVFVVVLLQLLVATLIASRRDSGFVFFAYALVMSLFSVLWHIGSVGFFIVEDGMIPSYGIAVGIGGGLLYVTVVAMEFRCAAADARVMSN